MITIQHSVESSTIRGYSHDAETNTGHVQFHGKTGPSVYQYDNVPASVMHGMAKAESAGKYFAQHIKNGGYQCTKLDAKKVSCLS